MKRVCLLTCFVIVAIQIESGTAETTAWYTKEANRQLKEALAKRNIVTKAKNVILFLGDGMGISTITAARILKGNLEGKGVNTEGWLGFDRFPNVGLSKTWTNDRIVSGSAGSGSSIMCGVKPMERTICIQPQVLYKNCTSYMENTERDGKSFLSYAIEAGKRAGVVTTARVTHATPAASYANSAARDWESDMKRNQDVPSGKGREMCLDIAYQLYKKQGINVVLGGGRRNFLPNTEADPDSRSTKMGDREDGMNLAKKWEKDRGSRAKYVTNKMEMDKYNNENVDFLMGLFNWDHLLFKDERDTTKDPSLPEMVTKAINILDNGGKNEKGFALLVEGAKIDISHHFGWANRAMVETVEFAKAIETAIEKTNLEDTLIVVTADHSHTFTIGGYATRATDIRDFSDYKFPGQTENAGDDGIKYQTLMYADGPGAPNGLPRQDISGLSTSDLRRPDYRIQAAIPKREETHGGEDVGIFSRGPWSHLIHSTHDQHYIAYVMRYATCMGEFKDEPHCSDEIKAAGRPSSMATLSIIAPIVASLYWLFNNF